MQRLVPSWVVVVILTIETVIGSTFIMPKTIKDTVAEATRLTQAGLIPEALAVLTGRAPGHRLDTSTFRPQHDPSLDLQPNAEITSMVSRLDLSSKLQGLVEFFGKVKRPLDTVAELVPFVTHPEVVAPDSQFVSRTFSNEAGSRTYKLFIPGADVEAPRSLIVMLHGCSQNPDDFAAGTRMNELAQEYGFFVAYPAQPPSANMARCWNWFNARDQVRGEGEPHILAGLTQDIVMQHGIDPQRVYVAGLSAGGAAAAVLGALYPDIFAAIGVHSGLPCGAARDASSAFSAMRRGGSDLRVSKNAPLPTIVFHGDRDTTVNPVNAEQVITQAKASGEFHIVRELGSSANGTDYTRIVYNEPNGHTVLEQWMIHGGSHAWSGGSPAGSYTNAGGPDASREMVRFFFDQRRKP
jgi:poly(hydroxyalkanoate) depolymerase family esterase